MCMTEHDMTVIHGFGTALSFDFPLSLPGGCLGKPGNWSNPRGTLVLPKDGSGKIDVEAVRWIHVQSVMSGGRRENSLVLLWVPWGVRQIPSPITANDFTFSTSCWSGLVENQVKRVEYYLNNWTLNLVLFIIMTDNPISSPKNGFIFPPVSTNWWPSVTTGG